jgi:hypothetical protein
MFAHYTLLAALSIVRGTDQLPLVAIFGQLTNFEKILVSFADDSSFCSTVKTRANLARMTAYFSKAADHNDVQKEMNSISAKVDHDPLGNQA